MTYYPQKQADPVEMKNIFNALLLMMKIFYDLSIQVPIVHLLSRCISTFV